MGDKFSFIISRYYIVAVVRSVSHSFKYSYPLYSLFYIGNELSVKLAEYTFSYLRRYYSTCFRFSCLPDTSNHRLNYYAGLNAGLYSSLFDFDSAEEKAIVVSAEAIIGEIHERANLVNAVVKHNLEDHELAREKGFQDGKKIKIRKGLEDKKETTRATTLIGG